MNACVASTDLMQFRVGQWYGEAKAQVKSFACEVSTCRAEGAGDKRNWYCAGFLFGPESLDNRIESVQVVEE